MSNPALIDMAKALQSTLEKVGTMAAHQSVLLGMLEKEIETTEQEALVFSLKSSQAAEFDWRVAADEKMSELLKMVEALNV